MHEESESQPRIVNLFDGECIDILAGIRGRAGARGIPDDGGAEEPMGLDLIEMEAGTSFPFHTHPGAHVLFVVEGEGTVTLGGAVYQTRPGDSIFIPGKVEHAVSARERHVFVAIGFPHRALDDPDRMAVVEGNS